MKHNSSKSASVEIIGADANNLKNVDVTFPLKQISVVTGVSGSGKSSLLADTLAAEGSRRMRIFLGVSQEEIEQDDVKAFIGSIPPTILVGQRGFRPSVRTTVGTATGFLSILRRLFVLASTPYSDQVKENVPPPSAGSYAKWMAKHYRGPAEIWAAPVRHQRTDGVSAVKRLALHGINKIIVRSETDPPRFRESGREVLASEFKGLNANVVHTIEALVDRIEISGTQQLEKLEKILDRAFAAGNGFVVVTLPKAINPDLVGPFGPRLDSLKHWVHPEDSAIYFRPSTHLLSFNAPEHEDSGACPECNGIGIGRRLRENILVSHPERSMRDGAFAIWTEKNYKYVNFQHETIEGLRGMCGFSPDVPWQKLPASARALVLNGSGDEPVFDRDRSGRKFGAARLFPGFRKMVIDKSAGGTKIAEQLAVYVETGPCSACGGTRWSFQARALRIGGVSVADILRMPFNTVEDFAMRSKFVNSVPQKMRSLVEAIRRHAHSIVAVGLGYLTGDRGMLEISEGESRRTRLARVLDAGEQGLCLLLDEPARGLHESDLSGLAESLEHLRGEHTIILNEHRETLWDIADHFVEVGPGAGSTGGEITYSGTRLNREPNLAQLRQPLPCEDQPKLVIRGASIHNIDNIECEIPLGRLTCITGVSGSGKSSLIRGVLAPALLKSVKGVPTDFSVRQGKWHSINGTRSITEVVALDQVMPPANRRSLVATFTGIFDNIRDVFGAATSAKLEGLSASDFGVNAGGGRCSVCAGIGEVVNGDLWSVCPSCGGSRYGQAALSVRIDGFNIEELLQTPVQNLGPRAVTFGIPTGLIAAIYDLGIGYIALGRRIDTLSGGEVQRLRLAMRLSSPPSRSMFFILDEPAVGLHPKDVGRIATALDRVLENGRNTVVIVEHDLQLIRSADWVIDFGPGSGPDGGKIVFAGPPRELTKARTQTGLALAGKLPKLESTAKAVAPVAADQKLAPKDQVIRTTALMRTLINGDAAATALDSSEGTAEPTVVVDEHFWAGRESWEVAGLDCEIPKLLLDVQRPSHKDGFTTLLEAWKKDKECWLAIQPFLTDMQVWGEELPESIIRTVTSHISKEGLQLVDVKGHRLENKFNVLEARATGKRLIPADNNEEALRHVLDDAFADGARYVELRDRNGRLRAIATDRLLDLEKPLIAPMVPVPSHFSRLDPRGRCPMCKGSRAVTELSEALIIANKKVPPDNEKFLTSDANAVMKGIRHNELNPFLRRLTREGLWNPKTSFHDLDRSKRDLILFGFWARPGAGSFLKSPNENPSEVASWLRWDGLYRHILSQVDRSKNAVWARRVHESAHPVRCGMCHGTGLQPFASLLNVGEVPFTEWALLSDGKRQLQLLDTLEPQTQRQKRTLARIQHCLQPLAKPDIKSTAAAVVKRSVESFTTMPAAELAVAD
jgi:excinuclease ABC A subunit